MARTQRSPDGARLRRLAGPADPDLVILLLHGGDETADQHRVPLCWPPALRMALFLRVLRRAEPRGTVHLLWNAVKGWDDGSPPVRDARWALAELRTRYPERPIVLIGHSMGGRVGVRVLGEAGVLGLVGLAPWLPADEQVPTPWPDRSVVLIHGDADRTIPLEDTARWAAQARLAATPDAVLLQTVSGGGHAMLLHLARWHRLAARGVNSISPRTTGPTDRNEVG